MKTRGNEYLDPDSSDSDNQSGYDSEAAEQSKSQFKRRKLQHSPSATHAQPEADPLATHKESIAGDLGAETLRPYKTANRAKQSTKTIKPGVVYLSSLPPYLKPSALRNLLTQRGFSPMLRLFLAPAAKAKNGFSLKKNSRQLYAEGWIEFKSKKTAKRCAETLNATTVGGRKGGFYHDDIWNMKYLRGVGWDDLMAQVREERREEEVKRMEERRQIANEAKVFLEGVEKGKKARGIEKSRAQKRNGRGAAEDTMHNGQNDVNGGEKGTWKQYRVRDSETVGHSQDGSVMGEDVKRVLSKIF